MEELKKLNKEDLAVVLFCIRADIMMNAVPLLPTDLEDVLEGLSGYALITRLAQIINWKAYIADCLDQREDFEKIEDELSPKAHKVKAIYYCKLCAFEGPKDQFVTPETKDTENEELKCVECGSLLVDRM